MMYRAQPFTLDKERIVTDLEKSHFVTVFQECDLGQKGYLSREDLKVAVVTAFGYKPSKLETDMMMAEALENNLPGLSIEQFTTLMSRKLAAQDRYDEIRQIFLAFDARCRAFLTLDDFKRAFANVTPHLPEQTVAEAFREVDRDLDGHISFKDFEIVMRHE
ncbi:EF-hand calcium-binding domain-containing protein 11 isoform X1 [Stegostoma tigrinum]|uniref:EF-hand calcium-binding domain-containing protein 11 isoform X1 n=1 Tax=Stegostoma tigrinum TaxID=3053191 RepID=UPI00202B3C53|nr:EF-hand calcium-binding domain-containing protein 11 isoform X1 [Stegostoma tigrinum]